MKHLRVAIVGCGKIADQHIAAIRRTPAVSVVAACDREALMAEQLAERHGIPCATEDLAAMLEHEHPDVVHITTPPASHYRLALQCLEFGTHVYVEKPFTLNTAEALRVIGLAREKGLAVTAGHNLQYTWENIAARDLVRSGFLGGAPVHIESYYTYSFGDANYARALLGDRQHWVRHLPGQLLHNIISHGIARIAEYMETDDPFVSAFGHTSPLLKQIGETDIVDEVRMHVSDGRNMTGYFVFSSQLSPAFNGYRLYGSKNSLVVDNGRRLLLRERNHGYKSYLNYFLQPIASALELLRNARRNIGRFVRSDFHDDSGLKNFVEAFYGAVRGERDLPLSYREILLTSKIMDRVFEQLADASHKQHHQVVRNEHVGV